MAISKLERAQRAAQIMQLRKEGLTYRAIGERVGLSYEMVRREIQIVMRQYLEDAKDSQHEIVMLELLRLDDLLTSAYQGAMNGEAKMIDAVLKIMERRAKLLGLDAQVTTRQVQLTVTPEQIGAMSDDELEQLIQQFEQ